MQMRQQTVANFVLRSRGVEGEELAGSAELVSACSGILGEAQRLG